MLTPLQLAEKQFNAYNERDINKFIACFHDEFTSWRMPSETPSVTSKEQLREFYVNHRFNLEGLHAELINRTIMGDKVFDYEEIWGVYERPYKSMAVFQIKEGLIHRAWFYFSE